ncbi:maltose alpha-D-glucosyltransferase, partial [Microbacterium sp. zg.Y909]|nr:maltose alpha-D-glucosyltransferase [Microbacterium sp. zg.Y909]
SEGHPLSHAANHIIAGMVRKVGGFTFQELNLTMEDIRDTAAVGADLSYDFVGRPGYHHALATGQTEFLRLALRTSLELGVQPVQLVHGMQNHDELTYELVHWATRHGDDLYRFRGEEITGGHLAEVVRAELTESLTGKADYNRVFTQNGIACTSTSLIAATRGIERLADIEETDVPAIRDAHLLLCAYNAWQPGVFALSGWDLVGMLTIPSEEVADLLAAGDTRWIERGAHDLLDADPQATRSAAGMPRGRALYGPLPAQLDDPDSFASGLAAILDLRREHGIATATQVDIPEVAHAGMLVLVHRLDDGDAEADAATQVTVLNFSAEPTEGTVRSEQLVPGSEVVDAASGETVGRVDDLRSFSVSLPAYGAMFLLLTPAAPVEE